MRSVFFLKLGTSWHTDSQLLGTTMNRPIIAVEISITAPIEDQASRRNVSMKIKLLLMVEDDKCSETVTEVNAVSRGGVDVIIGNLLLFRCWYK